MRAGIAVADSSAGNYAAIGILIALVERERSGKGQWVHTSLLQAQIAMMDFQAAAYLVEGRVPRSVGNDHPVATPMGVVPTLDGHINIGVAGERQWAGLCKAIGRPDLETHPGDGETFGDVDHQPVGKMAREARGEHLTVLQQAGAEPGQVELDQGDAGRQRQRPDEPGLIQHTLAGRLQLRGTQRGAPGERGFRPRGMADRLHDQPGAPDHAAAAGGHRPFVGRAGQLLDVARHLDDARDLSTLLGLLAR